MILTGLLRARRSDLEAVGLAADVQRGLAAGEFKLHFQPILRMASGQIEAAEALVRWRRGDGTTVPPARFVPQIENDPVFWPLTLELIDQALRQCRHWSHSGHDIAVAANISSATLVDERLPAELGRLLTENRVPPRHLQLEVTEGAIMGDPDLAVTVLRAIRALGVAVIAIDDFGTGYSSLGRLRDLPVDSVKLDRSFVAELGGSSDLTVVKPIIELAHGLGMAVTAEGIEDPETWRTLARLGCDHAQGFWIARPTSAPVFAAMLDDHRAADFAALSASGERRVRTGRRGDDLVAAALASDDAVLVVDDDGNFLGGNRAAMQLWGPQLEALAHGAALGDYLAPEPRAELEVRLVQLKRDGRYDGHWDLVLPDGRLQWCDVHATADVLPSRHVIVLRAQPRPSPRAARPHRAPFPHSA